MEKKSHYFRILQEAERLGDRDLIALAQSRIQEQYENVYFLTHRNRSNAHHHRKKLKIK